MRNISYTSFRRTALRLLLAVFVTTVVVAAFVLLLGMKPELLDDERQTGIPSAIPEENGYTSYSAEGICEVVLCGNPEVHGKEVQLWLTNPETNSVWLRAELWSVAFTYDTAGKITAASPDKMLGKTGFIRPGEYVETVMLSRELQEERTYVMIKISTYVESTRTSEGFFYINTSLFRQ